MTADSSAAGATAMAGSLDERVAALFATDPVATANPWPLWRDVQAAGPVVESTSMFLVTRHAEVKAVHKDVAHFSSDSRRRGTRATAIRSALTPERLAAFDEIAAFHALWMVSNDSPEHERLRTIAIRAFTPGRIAELQDAMRRYVDEAILGIAEHEVVDLMDLALEVPLMIMTDLLGIPQSDRERIKGFSRDWFEYQFVPDDRIFISLRAQRDLNEYVEGMIANHRRNPNATTLVAALLGAEHDERLTPQELAAMIFLLLFAGHETTSNLIASGMLGLLSHPDEWRKLTREPTLAATAVEELLRYVSPAQFLHRYAIEDVTVAGTLIPEGSTVTTLIAAANRDPRVFADPDALEVGRNDVGQHLAFGFGPHFCLGAALSRMEATIAVGELARRLPDMEPAADSFEWRGGAQLRGLKALPVRVGQLRTNA